MSVEYLLKGFTLPKPLEFENVLCEKNYGKFIAYPFEPGYGRTIGNSLRRILLTSIQGYSIVAIRIEALSEGKKQKLPVTSEYEPIPEVLEDTSEVIARLKQLRLRITDDSQTKMVSISRKGAGEIRGKDFDITGLEVATPDILIATLTSKADLDFEIHIEFGRGYVPAEEHEGFLDVVGTLPIDSIFLPVRRVKWDVENTRVGQRSDYDKLILEIWTDGTITPSNALAQAAKIAKEHYSVFINFDENLVMGNSAFNEEEARYWEILNQNVEDLELSVRSTNCLKAASIKTLGELVTKSEDEISRTRNFGKKSLDEIKSRLVEFGLTLGMTQRAVLESLKKKDKKG